MLKTTQPIYNQYEYGIYQKPEFNESLFFKILVYSFIIYDKK